MRRGALTVAKLAVGLAVSLGLGWLAVRGLDWGLVVDNLSGVSIPLLVLAFAVFMFAAWFRAFRWRVLFAKVDISVGRLFVVQHEGLGLSNLRPIRVTSEVTQLAVLTLRDGIGGALALATLAMERVIDVVASTLILGVAFFLVPEMKNFTVFVWGAITFTVFAVGLVRLFAWSESLTLVRRFKFFAEFVTVVKGLEQQRLRLLVSFGISVCYWLLVGVTAWIVSEAVDLPLSPLVATVVILGTIFFATVVPAAPSALGTFEFAVIYVLGYFGIDRTDGFGFAIICHAVFFLPATVIAIVFLPREGVGAFGWVRGLTGAAAGRVGR